MNNEQLLEGIARKICLSLGKRPDRYDDHMREEWMSFIPHAQEVIDHLSPMMKELVGRLDASQDILESVGALASYDATVKGLSFEDNVFNAVGSAAQCHFKNEKAIASLPKCWGGGV